MKASKVGSPDAAARRRYSAQIQTELFKLLRFYPHRQALAIATARVLGKEIPERPDQLGLPGVEEEPRGSRKGRDDEKTRLKKSTESTE
jgi:hypothetical protein